MISKEEALKLIERTSKYSHALTVSAIMRKLAERLGEDEEKWEIVGLLHDLDYDLVRDDASKHGMVTSEILRERLPPDCLSAIKSHDRRTGFKPESKLDKALIVSDTLALIIEEIEKRTELSVERIEEEIERVSNQQPWRENNLQRIEELDLEIHGVLQLVVESLRHQFNRNQK